MGNLEYRLIRALGHRLPPLPHASGVVNRLLKPLYLRRERGLVVCDVLGLRMELDPAEAVDGNLIFCPQLYDAKEIAFLLSVLKEDDTFVDVGSHKGYYSLMASTRISTGKIVAIEADPYTFRNLRRNIDLNDVSVAAFNYGVSDREEVLNLNVQTSGNRSGSSFLGRSDCKVAVQCMPLTSILKEAGVTAVKCMKLDIEGYEYRVLDHFFDAADESLYPRYVITEFHPDDSSISTGNQLDLLVQHGYEEVARTNLNRILAL